MSDQFKALIINQEGEKFTREIKSIDNNIPLLIDLFDILIKNKNNDFPLYLDIKGTKRIVPHLIKILKDLKKKYNMKKVYIGSFNILIIELLYNSNKNLRIN